MVQNEEIHWWAQQITQHYIERGLAAAGGADIESGFMDPEGMIAHTHGGLAKASFDKKLCESELACASRCLR